MRNRWRLVLCSVATAALPQNLAQAEDLPPLQTIYILKGKCDRLVTPDRDLTATCGGAMGHAVYLTGRQSYWFAQPGQGLISFSGMHEAAVGEEGVLQIDKVTIGSDPGVKISGGEATGSCTFSNPWIGSAYVRCTARTSVGEYGASFTTDGQPPEKIGS